MQIETRWVNSQSHCIAPTFSTSVLQIKEEVTGCRSVQNVSFPLSWASREKASRSSHLLPLRFYFSLFWLVGTSGPPDILTALVIFEHYHSRGCQWDFSKTFGREKNHTTPAMLIIQSPLRCSEANVKHYLAITRLKKLFLIKVLPPL